MGGSSPRESISARQQPLRERARTGTSQPYRADTLRFHGPGGRDLSRADGRGARRAAAKLCGDLRSLPPPGRRAPRARCRPRRHGLDHGPQRAGDAGGPFRRADGGRRAQRAQYPTGRRIGRLDAEPRALPRSHRRRRVREHRGGGAGAARPSAARGDDRRSGGGRRGGEGLRRRELRGAARHRRAGFRVALAR